MANQSNEPQVLEGLVQVSHKGATVVASLSFITKHGEPVDVMFAVPNSSIRVKINLRAEFNEEYQLNKPLVEYSADIVGEGEDKSLDYLVRRNGVKKWALHQHTFYYWGDIAYLLSIFCDDTVDETSAYTLIFESINRNTLEG